MRQVPALRKRTRPEDPDILMECAHCRKVRPGSLFVYERGRGRYSSWCKPCMRKRDRVNHGLRSLTDPDYVERMNRKGQKNAQKKRAERIRDREFLRGYVVSIIRDLQAAGVSLRTMAARTGVDRRTLSYWLHPERSPHHANRARLQEAVTLLGDMRDELRA